MTKFTRDETCSRCGSLLFPHYLAQDRVIPATAELVCLNCGRLFAWTGRPSRLTVVSPTAKPDQDDDEQTGRLSMRPSITL